MNLGRKVLYSIALVALPLIAGCNSKSTTPTPPPAPSFVYYTTFNNVGPGNAQVGLVAFPVTNASTLALTLNDSVGNGLADASAMLTDASGRLFVLNDTAAPETIGVFTPPLTATSVPTFVLTLPVSIGNQAFTMTLDSSGNLWVNNANGFQVVEFNGPFTTNATLVANVTITTIASRPQGIAFDSAGNLYVSLNNSVGANSIGVYLKGTGFTNATPVDHYLAGLTRPNALLFDKSGNLYASSNTAGGGIAMYKSTNLGTGATPDVVDSTGLLSGFFEASYAFDPSGNLYAADCGSTAKIYVYPTGSQALSTTLAPTTVFSDANIVFSNCVWGIAIH